jgi:hypothetical protein
MSQKLVKRSMIAVVSLVAVAALVGGCSSESKSAEEKYCDSWQDVVGSFKSIEEVSITASGIENLDTAVNNVTASVGKLASAADSMAEPKVTALQDSLSSLGDLVTSPQISTSYLAKVSTALSDVDAAWNDLVATLKTSCPDVKASSV